MSLKKNDLEYFRKRLEDARRQMLHNLEGTNREVKDGGDDPGYSQHQADHGTDTFDRTISLEVSNKEYGILRQIERALEKMDEETYGVCDLTEKEIPRARLEAIPWANMTVEAQDKFEKGLL